MKNLFLTLVFTLSGAFAFNANATEINEEVLAIDCIGFAFDLEECFGKFSYELFDAIVTACENVQ